MFLHDAVFDAITCGDTEITTDKYQSVLKTLKAVNTETGSSGLESQFTLLSQVTVNPNDVLCDTAKSHYDKNRSKDYLPR